MSKGKFNLWKNLHSKDLILLQRQQMSKQCKQSARLWFKLTVNRLRNYNVLYMLICHFVMLNLTIKQL